MTVHPTFWAGRPNHRIFLFHIRLAFGTLSSCCDRQLNTKLTKPRTQQLVFVSVLFFPKHPPQEQEMHDTEDHSSPCLPRLSAQMDLIPLLMSAWLFVTVQWKVCIANLHQFSDFFFILAEFPWASPKKQHCRCVWFDLNGHSSSCLPRLSVHMDLFRWHSSVWLFAALQSRVHLGLGSETYLSKVSKSLPWIHVREGTEYGRAAPMLNISAANWKQTGRRLPLSIRPALLFSASMTY